MTGFINTFDLIIIIIACIFNYLFFSQIIKIKFNWIFTTALLLLFIGILPYISTKIEVTLVRSAHDADALDGFNLAYIWLKWPMYWIIGLLELAFLPMLRKRRTTGAKL